MDPGMKKRAVEPGRPKCFELGVHSLIAGDGVRHSVGEMLHWNEVHDHSGIVTVCRGFEGYAC